MRNIYHLRDLKPNHRKELMANLVQGRSPNVYNQGESKIPILLSKISDSTASFVNNSMTWSNTRQGHDYWEIIRHNLETCNY